MNPVALITGGARGIGLGISRRLVREHWDLALCGLRDPIEVEPVLRELSESGNRVEYIQADISRPDDREHLVSETRRRFGRLNALINNAGVGPKDRKDILEATEESFDHVLDTNLKGPYFLTQKVAGWLMEQRQPGSDFSRCIIFITSISAETASVNRGEYCISKAALSMTSKLWAVRLAEFGIQVFEVRPGIIETDMTSGVKKKYDDLIEGGILLQKRWGSPADVGKAVAMLLRGDLGYSPGQVIMVDGGFSVSRL